MLKIILMYLFTITLDMDKTEKSVHKKECLYGQYGFEYKLI